MAPRAGEEEEKYARESEGRCLLQNQMATDHRGHPPMTQHVSLMEVPGHSHAQQLVAQLGSASKSSSTTVTLRLSDMGGTDLNGMTHLILPAAKHGTNLYLLLLGKNHDTGDTGLFTTRSWSSVEQFLRMSEGEMFWETSPHSNNPAREGLPRRWSCMMPELHMGRSHLTSILTPMPLALPYPHLSTSPLH